MIRINHIYKAGAMPVQQDPTLKNAVERELRRIGLAFDKFHDPDQVRKSLNGLIDILLATQTDTDKRQTLESLKLQ